MKNEIFLIYAGCLVYILLFGTQIVVSFLNNDECFNTCNSSCKGQKEPRAIYGVCECGFCFCVTSDDDKTRRAALEGW